MKTNAMANLVFCLYAVDTFFFIGGFFLAYSIVDLKALKFIRKAPHISFPMTIVHRLFRIWPAYLVLIFYYTQ